MNWFRAAPLVSHPLDQWLPGAGSSQCRVAAVPVGRTETQGAIEGLGSELIYGRFCHICLWPKPKINGVGNYSPSWGTLPRAGRRGRIAGRSFNWPYLSLQLGVPLQLSFGQRDARGSNVCSLALVRIGNALSFPCPSPGGMVGLQQSSGPEADGTASPTSGLLHVCHLHCWIFASL